MDGRRPSLEALNAYVDNELPAREAAEIARAVARDPALARQVALLARLRSALAESVEAPQLPLPERVTVRPWRRWLVAACLAGLVALAAGLALLPLRGASEGEDWLAAAWRLHDGWQAQADAGTTPSSLPASAVLRQAYVPDLSASRLSVAHVATRPFVSGRSATVIGYTGTRGCKLTLVIAALGRPLDGSLGRFVEGERTAYGWRAGGLDFLLLAEAMDGERFDLIARSVYRATIERLPFDDATRTALSRSRRGSAPCPA